jgi:amidohydrolase
VEVIERVKEHTKEIVDLRRTLHQHPEVAHKEFETHKILLEHLRKLDLDIKAPVAGTGIVADLQGKSKGKTVAIRADIDGLPITEETGVSFKSQNDGFMHACGHDAHMSMAFGAALALSNMKEQINGTIRFLLQPAEEVSPGGAKPMIEEGVLDGVDYIIGQHVWPALSQGLVGYRAGPFFAAADDFDLKVIGKGGHGAKPHLTIDPILISAKVLEALQTISSREIAPLEPIVVTVASIHAGTAYNIIPNFVEMKGTVRTLNPNTRNRIEEMMRRVIGGVTSSAGASFEFTYKYGYPVLINNKEVTARVAKSATLVMGEGHVLEWDQTMGAEDFAYYLQKVPGTIWYLGVRNEKLGYTNEVHTSKFNIDEAILPYGSAVLVQSAVDLLSS